MSAVKNFKKNINWDYVEFDEGMFQFLPLFSCVSHLE